MVNNTSLPSRSPISKTNRRRHIAKVPSSSSLESSSINSSSINSSKNNGSNNATMASMATKNPKMSLENLMLPFDQQVESPLTPPKSLASTYGDSYIQMVPSQARSYYIPTPPPMDSQTYTPRHLRQVENVQNLRVPSGNTTYYANYSFGPNVIPRTSSSIRLNTAEYEYKYNNHHYTNSAPTTTIQKTTFVPSCSEPKAKRPWAENEDIILRGLVAKLGPGLWAAMAQQIPGRTGKQVRERWLNHLSPSVTKRPWSIEEDNVIIDQHMKIGNCWSRIAKLLEGRSDNSVKNRYYTTLRRRISRKRSLEEEGGGGGEKRQRVWE